MNTGSQVTDQTIKGVVIGAVAYFLAKGNVDPAIQASIIPVITAGLAYASTKVGDKNVASFITKIAAEAPKVIAEVEKEVAKQKTAAKKPAAKKKA